MMIDTHCHIDEEAFDADREEVIARQKENGVAAMIVPGVNVASIASVMDVCHRHKGYCFPALGLHPEDVKEHWEEDLRVIEEAIRAHREELVAIGEIGLDYYWDKTYKEAQKEVLRRQLAIAIELDLPVILHNREATEDILQITNYELRNTNGHAPLRGVFHCYSGSKETAEIILKMGFYLGIGGVVTFKNSKLAETLAELNKSYHVLDRLLLETDAPYMSPVPYRGKRNESQYMIHVAEKLSDALNCPREDIIRATERNTNRLFCIKMA